MGTGAHELVALGADAIFAGTSPTVRILQQATASIPIIFALVIDPVALGYVKSLARPGGNTTGFTNFEPSMGGKWLSLLKEIAPSIKRVACMRNPDLDLEVGPILLQAISNARQSFSLDITTAEVRNDNDIENSIRFLSANDGAFIYLPGNFNPSHLPSTIELAAHYRVPAIYGWDYMATAGGLVSYGSAWEDEMRGAASYIDRVLRGANPSDLPVQAPTKFKLVVNLKTAKTLGLTVPVTLLVSADEVIE
jgi:putative tryptophan/tyrosine transport system substrate-binding protein